MDGLLLDAHPPPVGFVAFRALRDAGPVIASLEAHLVGAAGHAFSAPIAVGDTLLSLSGAAELDLYDGVLLAVLGGVVGVQLAVGDHAHLVQLPAIDAGLILESCPLRVRPFIGLADVGAGGRLGGIDAEANHQAKAGAGEGEQVGERERVDLGHLLFCLPGSGMGESV